MFSKTRILTALVILLAAYIAVDFFVTEYPSLRDGEAVAVFGYGNEASEITIYITGAVNTPGIYELPSPAAAWTTR